MHKGPQFWIVLLAGAASCAELLGTEAPYHLVADDVATGGGGGGASVGAGGNDAGVPCIVDQDCLSAGLDCAHATCNNGECKIVLTATGLPCNAGTSGVCNGQGTCVECTLPEHCTSIIEDECTQRACTGNLCQAKYPGPQTLASTFLQTQADCKRVVCDGLGGTKSAIDNTDLPSDFNPCTADSCENGVAIFTSLPNGAVCGPNSTCNIKGKCVGCASADQCPGTDDFCKVRTCASQTCEFVYTPDMTPLPTDMQTTKDCKILVCDGMGNQVLRPDPTDLPIDGNSCTQDLCSTGVPSNPTEPVNTTCGTNGTETCDGNGACKIVKGQTCALSAECLSGFCVDGVCCESACDATCKSCNLAAGPGTCSNVPKWTDDESALSTCSGATHTCNGLGACKLEVGQVCSVAGDCVTQKCTGNPKKCQP